MKCRSCGAEIEFVLTPAGKKIPVEGPYLAVITDQGEVIRGRQSHFATCPQADRWRKRK